MSREQTYAHLLNQVSLKEKKYESLRMANENKSEILHQLQIENDNKKKLTSAKKDSDEQTQKDNSSQVEDSLELEFQTRSIELEQL